MSDEATPPTAMQLFAKELVNELRPLLADLANAAAGNQLMTVPEIAKELRIRQATVRSLINAGTLRRAPDLREMRVKRSEVSKFGTRDK